jgi:hypothetical protein
MRLPVFPEMALFVNYRESVKNDRSRHFTGPFFYRTMPAYANKKTLPAAGPAAENNGTPSNQAQVELIVYLKLVKLQNLLFHRGVAL